MKILIICSTSFYDKIDDVRKKLEKNNHIVHMPNCYDSPVTNQDNKKMTEDDYLEFFKRMYYESRKAVSLVDAVLVLNSTKEKNGEKFENYIGASTFLEMYEAFMQNKKIFMINDFPDNLLIDEIKGFNPIIINGNLDKIK